jgi:hypothetical protein
VLEDVLATLIKETAEFDAILVLVMTLNVAFGAVAPLDVTVEVVAAVEDIVVGETMADVDRVLVDSVEGI